MSAEQLKLLSRRIDPSLPVSPLGSPSKPVLPAIFTNNEEDDEQKPCPYVCTPCNKKYKTRNGLAYHLDRCVHISTINQSAAKPTGVLCVCDHPTDDKGMMVQCDECQLWLHLDCLGTNDSVLDDIYHCPRCIEQSKRAKLVNLPKSEEDSTNYISNIPTDIKSSTIQQQIWSDFDLAEKAKPTTTINKNDVNMWGLSTADIPSLLYSDAMPSTLDDDLPYLMDLPSSDLSPHDLPPTDWFQFANFDDDFHCDDSQTTTQ
ncbi:uncharacterized protein BX664DRAFT_270046 [Halteromyces radiatus]|uniref:uncharacterized protein n=1 Tax=Halteromyces radiatus TaxID=101107 RepID=UPI00221E62E3|nr:uncharacterized protein BX664DRAFT_270046 [Halteromyces radiatus]KAI8078676.1 hypothetical protein BX664DRAFT_270046 [Halteromyces radiatus]